MSMLFKIPQTEAPPLHSFLNKPQKKKQYTVETASSNRSVSQNFPEFDLSTFRDKAALRHSTTFLSNALPKQREQIRGRVSESPMKLNHLRDRISQIGVVKQTTISLYEKVQKKSQINRHLADNIKLDDLWQLRNELDNCTSLQVQGLSQTYINELVKLQQCIHRSLRQIPDFKSAII